VFFKRKIGIMIGGRDLGDAPQSLNFSQRSQSSQRQILFLLSGDPGGIGSAFHPDETNEKVS